MMITMSVPRSLFPIVDELEVHASPEPASFFAEIVFDRPMDHAYTYAVPDRLAAHVAVGKRVEAPFGKGDRGIPGFCVRVASEAPTRAVKAITYGTTGVVGLIVTLAALRPPERLQYLIIFTTGGMACTFLAPTVLALYSKRATKAGALAAMIGGFVTLMTFYILGWNGIGKEGLTGPAAQKIAPVYLFGLDPLVYGMIVSLALGIIVSRFTSRLPQNHVDRYFLTSQAVPGA